MSVHRSAGNFSPNGTGGRRRAFRGKGRCFDPGAGRRCRRCGDGYVFHDGRHLSGCGRAWRRRHLHRSGSRAAIRSKSSISARDAAGGGNVCGAGQCGGFALMQSAYGALPWQKDVAPGEGYARTGFPSRTLWLIACGGATSSASTPGLPPNSWTRRATSKAWAPSLQIPNWPIRCRRSAHLAPCALYRPRRRQDRCLFLGSGRGDNERRTRRLPAAARLAARDAARFGLCLSADSHTGAGAFAGSLLDNLARAEATPTGSKSPDAAVIVAVKMTLDGFGVKSLPKDLGARVSRPWMPKGNRSRAR